MVLTPPPKPENNNILTWARFPGGQGFGERVVMLGKESMKVRR